ncbi:3872_t:CDS:2 [Paraglomus brasilianum]|uniref:3872_t:CDS:1 n=1 Tax=Paraglomus brasilianum TaxID=144538 RepID=A0A9N9CP40_9GLOM|nr:3872_t:CDS:2 [Paraglomus brasilianum]
MKEAGRKLQKSFQKETIEPVIIDGIIMPTRIVGTLLSVKSSIVDHTRIPISKLYCFLTVKAGPLKKWEIEKLRENYTLFGNKWSFVVRDLKGRSPLQAKNFFNAEKRSLKSVKKRMSVVRIVNENDSTKVDIPESFKALFFVEDNRLLDARCP